MNIEDRKVQFIRDKFPDTIQQSDGTPWLVDELHRTEIGETRSGSFYYENADMPADRFYFDTFEEAALDLFDEIATHEERQAAEEWSGSQHPDRPDDAWLDDETDESVCAHCAGRGTTLQTIEHQPGCTWVAMVEASH